MAAVLGGHGHAEEAEVAHGARQVARELFAFVELEHARRDLALGELAHGAAEHVLLGGEVEVHARDDRARPAQARKQAPRANVRRGQKKRKRVATRFLGASGDVQMPQCLCSIFLP